MIYATRILPDLFHGTPEEFIQLLDQRGNDFLRFYWEIASKDSLPGSNPSVFGLNYAVRTFLKETTICLITLPKPVREPEPYFAALIYRPYRRTPFLGIMDMTKVINLDWDSSQPEGTLLREWDKHLQPEPLRPGPAPKLENFYQAVCQLIRPESR